jgi:alanyl-tRNA synthetase
MTSSEIRQSFLDFFRSNGHTIVPSSSLMPDAPNLLFTNAGMNQFVPIFLGQRAPDVDRWPGAVSGLPTRAADTQKCIRAGGKHNDLEDVGLDTYHHTFFEMLGNWSFGDYFKKEAIEWAWELVAKTWKFPKERLYATVYKPGPGDPSAFDQEAYDLWAAIFIAAGLDPKIHIQFGGKKDNFWMMGDTGPCGPCSELHVDLTPLGDTRGALVNQGSPGCIEIWNLVFIQFNANPDGTFAPLPSRHVDTGMGFERVTSIIQNTKGFTDFSSVISNYETDIFRPLFDELEKLSGKKYASTLPISVTADHTEQEKIDVAFRVIADHIRTLSFAIADGVQPGNTDRNYVLRRILRRAVRYGRALGFHQPFFYKLAGVLADTMGSVFPEIRQRQKHVENVIRVEEEAFNRTLDRGLEFFEDYARRAAGANELGATPPVFRGEWAFTLYDTYGFPYDLTELLARERGMIVDKQSFDCCMDQQKQRARAAQKKEIISISEIEATSPTQFVGFDKLQARAKVVETVALKDKTAVILDTTPFYPEMGGQVGDTGELGGAGQLWRVANTQKAGQAVLHVLDEKETPLVPGTEVDLAVDATRRFAIQRHHTVTHLLHWAIHEVAGQEAAQKGSYVGPEKLTFDFNSAPLTPQQLSDIERLVNERIVENSCVSWTEVPFSEIRGRKDVMQFFGEKYGENVRVVQIGGKPSSLDGYSMELCGGTHARATGEIGLFRIMAESAIAAGVRRIEATAGLEALEQTKADAALIDLIAGKLNAPVGELARKIDALLAQQKEIEKQLKTWQQKQASETARALLNKASLFPATGARPELRAIIEDLGSADGDYIQSIADALKGQFGGVVVLGGVANNAVALVATVSPDLTSKVQAGKIIQQIAPVVGGKGGGRPDNARGGGKDASRLSEALARAKSLLE